MADEKSPESVWKWPSLLAIAALMGGLYFKQPSLQSPRPPENATVEHATLGDQTVQARLWQDPLDAVHKYHEDQSSMPNGGSEPAEKEEGPTPSGRLQHGSTTLNSLARQIGQQVRDGLTNITVLFKLVPGGPYAEDVEVRLRARYAMLAGLGVAGYVPVDEEHLGYFEVPWIQGSDWTYSGTPAGSCLELADNAGTRPLLVPYEWFQQSRLYVPRTNEIAGRAESVLLLWLSANEFEDHPCKRLAQLKRWLERAVNSVSALRSSNSGTAGQSANATLPLTFKLFDPRLLRIVEEIRADEGSGCRVRREDVNAGADSITVSNELHGLEVYSSWSTTADALLIPDELTNQISARVSDEVRPSVLSSGEEARHFERRGFARELLSHRGLKLINVTCTDYDLARALVDELKLRGIDLMKPSDGVVLVSEWDTFYGRALPLTLATEVKSRMLRFTSGREPESDSRWDRVAHRLTANSGEWPTHIIRATYFRGVDGLLPGESMPKANVHKGPNAGDDAETAMHPFGRSQLDYMPRLARTIRDLDVQAQSRGCSVKAIGVLGSDVYDKLLLLQALHKAFPKVIFFTTDLDARLFDADQIKTTRNLIVASSFDLGLSQRWREAIPPFRDSYQTAQFIATRLALSPSRLERFQKSGRLEPRLFEIGRNGPYALEPPIRPWSSEPAGASGRERFHSGRPSGVPPRGRVVEALIALLLTAALILSYGDKNLKLVWRRNATDPTAKRGIFPTEVRLYILLALCAILFFTLLACLIWQDHFDENGEPFSLLGGISLWPTEIIRLSALVLSGAFIVKATYDFKRNDLELEKEFALVKASPDEAAVPVSGWVGEFPWRLAGFIRELFSWKGLRDTLLISSMQANKGQSVNARALWNGYKVFGRAPHRCRRYLLGALCYTAIAALVTRAFGGPFRPFRGQVCDVTDQVLMYLSVGALFVLLFFVVDATLLCRRFIKLLAARNTTYPEAALQPHHKRRRIQMKYLDEWLDMQLIGRRTEVVGKLIYYPFIVLALMVVSHNQFFDHLQWPPSLLLVFGGLLAYALYCAVTLRLEANRARNSELSRVQDEYLAEEAQGEAHADTAERIKQLIEEIKANETGAFAPLAQHPVLRVLALPFGSAGLLGGLDFLALL